MSSRNMEDIAEFMKTLRFQKTLVGGISERDVWRQLDRLQKEYQSAYECQEERFQALLKEREEEIARLRAQPAREPPSKEGFPLKGKMAAGGKRDA